MKTAEEYLVDVCNNWAMSQNEREALAKVLNHARKELIIECSEVVSNPLDHTLINMQDKLLNLLKDLK